MKRALTFLPIFLLPSLAYAEVLDKFGGCRWPSNYWVLLAFATALLFLLALKRISAMKFAAVLSFLYIAIETLLPFLMAKKLIPSWYDQAIFDYYRESQSCQQYEIIGYWQLVWLTIFIYLAFVICLWTVSKKRS